MIDDEIQNDLYVTFFGLGDQAIEISESSVLRIDIAVIGDVIPKIYLRRREAGRNRCPPAPGMIPQT